MGFAARGRAWWGGALHRWCASLPACLLTLAGLALLLPGAARAEAVMRVLAWPGYADPDFVAVFEKRHGVKVEITTVASDDVLRAKMESTEGPGVDLVAANTAEIARLILHDKLAPLPLGNIRNTAGQLPRFRQLHTISGIGWRGLRHALHLFRDGAGVRPPAVQHAPAVDCRAVGPTLAGQGAGV